MALPPSTRTAPEPAPGAAEHPALDLANSAPTGAGGAVLDLLATPDAATVWLVERGLAPSGAALQDVCAARLRSLREEVRALLAARTAGAEPPAGALAAVNAALVLVPTASALHWDPERGLHRANVHPVTQVVERALAALATDAAELLTGPDAARLAACSSPPCTRFLVRTHARRHWCSTRCGDRARAARAYARRTGTAAAVLVGS